MAEGALAGLARGTLIYGLGGGLTGLLGLLTLPVFTRFLTPADYGISSILVLVSFFVTPIFSLGLSTSLGVCYFDSEDRAHRDRVRDLRPAGRAQGDKGRRGEGCVRWRRR